MGRWAISAVMLALGGCFPACEPPDAVPDGDVPADAPLPDAIVSDGGDAGATDAGGDDSGATDAGGDAATADATADARPADAAMDAGPCGPCEPSGECLSAECIDDECVELPRENGTACGEMGMDVCVDGACVARTGCGDGFREPGPDPMREGCDDGNTEGGDACSAMCMPTVLVVSSEPDGEDFPSGPKPGVGIDGRGGALFVWTAIRLSDTGTGEPTQPILARRYTRGGVPVDAEPLVIAADVGAEWPAEPTVAGLRAGGWVVTWSEPDDDAGDFGSIAYREVAADGTLGVRRFANADTRGHQYEPAIASLEDGVVIAWTDELVGLLSGEPSQSEIRARLVTAGAHPCGEEIVVSAMEGAHAQPSVASQPEGLLVAWTDGGPVPFDPTDPPAAAVRGARFDTDGCALDAASFRVSQPLPASGDEPVPDGYAPSAAALEGGDYAVAWTERYEDARGNVRARVVRAVGEPAADPAVAIATAANTPERLASAAPLPGGGFAVLYHFGAEGGSLLRDIDVVSVDGSLAPEAPLLRMHLGGDAIEQDGFVVPAPDGLWAGWSDDGTVDAEGFESEAFRSYLAFLLAGS